MLRIILSKAQECRKFWKPFKPCHVGIHWKALAESYQMSTHVPGFPSFHSLFYIISYWPNQPPAAQGLNSCFFIIGQTKCRDVFDLVWLRINDKWLTINVCFALCFSETLDTLTEELGIHKVVFLRSICRKIGVTIMLRDYSLDNKNKQTFFEEDIVNIFPVVKHIHPKVGIVYLAFSTIQSNEGTV